MGHGAPVFLNLTRWPRDVAQRGREKRLGSRQFIIPVLVPHILAN